MSNTYNGILSTIAHTPLINLNKVYEHTDLNLYAKLEMFNPGGSIKDRPAAKIITDALAAGDINENSTIIESSSGNMAIGLAQMCRYYGLKLIVVVDPKINSHTLKILKTYGARIEKVSKTDEDGNYLNERLKRVHELLNELPDGYWPNQYANRANPASHHQTMAEIVDGLPQPPDYLFASTSTCGTIMGCAEYVRRHALDTKIVAVDAVGSVIFGGSPAERLIPGHGAGRPSDLLEKSLIDHVVHISDQECINGCYRLLDREAILAGGSSGAVFSAVDKLSSEIPQKARCTLILPDSGERYLDTIYNDQWLETHFGEHHSSIPAMSIASEKKTNVAKDTSYSKSENTEGKGEPRKIAIIGGGPKGMYGFERLAAQLKAHPVNRDVEIHIYNKSAHFGAGENYQPKQPDYLLINNPIGDIDMWIDEKPVAVVPKTFSLTEWLQKKKDLNVTEKDYVSRSLVGTYLQDGFEAIAHHLPKRVNGKYIAGEVIDICKQKEAYGIKILTGAADRQVMPHKYHHILLATGHPHNKLSDEEKAYKQFAQQHDDRGFIPFIYPVESNLHDVSPHSSVAIKGIGLTFIDAVLTLTEGRDGTFNRTRENGKLSYIPSGKEPEVIYPFSRSGLPMIPRAPAPENATSLKFFTKDTVTRFKTNSPNNKLDFKLQILPLLYQEMEYAFYNIQLKQLGFKDNLHACATYEEVQHYIDLFHEHHPNIERFSPELFLKPLHGQQFQTAGLFHGKIKDYLQFFLSEAKKGEFNSPWAAVSAVWRKATPVFAKIYASGGLKPSSQSFFDTTFRRLLNRVTFGPPVETTEKIIALMEAEKLDFSVAQNPEVELNEQDGTFLLRSEDTVLIQNVSFLVNARIPNVSLEKNKSPLHQNLMQRGLIKAYQNQSETDTYQPGCPAISPEGFAITHDETVNPSIAFTGTPTEGITFDNDTLSRTRNNFVSNWATVVRKSCSQSSINTPSY